LADGGLWANCPALQAIIDAKTHLDKSFEQIKVLSIGTGTSRQFYPLRARWWHYLIGWGLLTRWDKSKFIDLIMNLQADASSNAAWSILKNNFLRINFKSDKNLPLDEPADLLDLLTKADMDFTYKAGKICEFLDLTGPSKHINQKDKEIYFRELNYTEIGVSK